MLLAGELGTGCKIKSVHDEPNKISTETRARVRGEKQLDKNKRGKKGDAAAGRGS